MVNRLVQYAVNALRDIWAPLYVGIRTETSGLGMAIAINWARSGALKAKVAESLSDESLKFAQCPVG